MLDVRAAAGRLGTNEALARQVVKLARASDSVDAFVQLTRSFGSFDEKTLADVYKEAQGGEPDEVVGVPAQNVTINAPAKLNGLDSEKSSSGPLADTGPALSSEDVELDRQWYSDTLGIPDPDDWEATAVAASKPGTRAGSVTDIESATRIYVDFDAQPPFLKGFKRGALNPAAQGVSIFRDPSGRLAQAAKAGSALVRLRRAQKERRKQAQDAASTAGTALGKVTGADAGAAASKPRSQSKSQKPISEEAVRRQILAQRISLPAHAARQELLSMIRQNQVVIVIGETGSGKTTQLPQFLLEDGLAEYGLIGCTQPRRVAAMSVAERVAAERGARLGGEVGYTIRFEDRTSHATKIKFMTDGILLRECLSEPFLDKYSCIIIDEAHERSLSTDILFGLFRRILSQRLDLKLIITSATLNADTFSSFFGGAPLYTIPGRTFPVTTFNVRSPVDDYVSACVTQVLKIHLQSQPGDILVFMTGQEDIETTVDEIETKLAELQDAPPLLTLPMYSQLPADMQAQIFLPAPPGVRKVIVSTNIAETSLTVDGIRFVVDSGLTKVKVYKPQMGIDALQVAPVSLDTAAQRAGRAGRTSEGYAYRIYTKQAEATEMYQQAIPEISRTNMANTVLLLKSLGVKHVAEFNFLDPPPPASVQTSEFDLWALGALDDAGALTSMGAELARFPMDPGMARLLLAAADRGCTAEMLTIVSMMSVPSVFVRSAERARESDRARERFLVAESDHLTLLNVYDQWRAHRSDRRWATQNFLQERSLERAAAVRAQLVALIQSVLGRPVESAGRDWDVVRRCICQGYFQQAARAKGLRNYIGLRSNVTSQIHPTSALFGAGNLPDYVVYHELILTSQQYMTTVTAIEPEWLLEDGAVFYYTDGAERSLRKGSHADESAGPPTDVAEGANKGADESSALAKPAVPRPLFKNRSARVQKSKMRGRAMRGV